MGLTDTYIISHENRIDNDYYPTAPIATFLLQKSYDLSEDIILDPAAGRCWLTKELDLNGHETISKDLFPYENPMMELEVGEDFLLSEKDKYATAMVTNPPFKSNMPEKFVKKSLELYDKTIIFSRVTFLESGRRGKFFKEYPFTKLIMMSSRVNCNERYFTKTKKQIGGMVAYGWYIWDNNPIKNQIEFVDPKDLIEEFIDLRGEKYNEKQ